MTVAGLVALDKKRRFPGARSAAWRRWPPAVVGGIVVSPANPACSPASSATRWQWTRILRSAEPAGLSE